MASIQSLHDLVNVNETQQGAEDRITGSEVRGVDNAIIDEIALRGAIQVPSVDDVPLSPINESKTLYVSKGNNDDGVYVLVDTESQVPDFDKLFPSADPLFLWKRIGGYASTTFIRSTFSSNNGIVYNSTSGLFSLGQTWNSAPIVPSSMLLEHREINLNTFAMFFVESHAPARRVHFGAGNMVNIQNDSIDLTQNDSQNINSFADRRFQAAMRIDPLLHTIRVIYKINGNVNYWSAENVHVNTWIDSEYTNDTGYPGGIITTTGNAAASLMVETGLTGSFTGGWTGTMANILTRGKFTGTGGVTGDKFHHIIINVESQARANTLLNEHVGLFINDLRLPLGTATSTIAINQAGTFDKNIFAGIMILSTPQTPASSADPGTTGTIRWDEGFIYVKTASGGWKRAALTTF